MGQTQNMIMAPSDDTHLIDSDDLKWSAKPWQKNYNI